MTDQNIEDLGTRTSDVPADLVKGSVYQDVPPWLQGPIDGWPRKANFCGAVPQVKWKQLKLA